MRRLVAAAIAVLALALGAPAQAQVRPAPEALSVLIANSPVATQPFGAADVIPVVQNWKLHHLPISGTGAVMLPDASNATVPAARDAINAGLIMRSVLDYGAKCDGRANDTAAFQAAAAASPNLAVPAGTCNISGFVIGSPISLHGQGKGITFLNIPSATANPALTITVAGYTGPFPANVELSDMTITSPNRDDATGHGIAHGIKLKDATVQVRTKVSLNNVTIGGVPGDAIHVGAGEFLGGSWVEAHNVDIVYPGSNGIFANTTFDWRWFGGEIVGAEEDNVLYSGTSAMVMVGTNIYVAQKKGVHLFDADRSEFVGVTFDTSGEESLYVDNRTGGSTKIVNSRIRWASTKTNATYSDLTLSSLNTGDVFLSNVDFPSPATSPSTNKPLRNITITGGDTGTVYASNVSYELGNWLTAGVLNAIDNYSGIEPPRAWTPTLVGTTGGSGALSIAVGSYSVSEKRVSATGTVQSTSLAGLTGDLRIGGLPITSTGMMDDQGVCVMMPTIGWTAPATKWTALTGLIGAASTEVQPWRNSNDGTSSAATAVGEWANASKLQFSCSYHY